MLACPRCHRALSPDAEELRCEGGHDWPVRHGIPDLRVSGDPYLSVDDDYRAADRLAQRAGGGYEQMLSAYYAENAKVTAAQAERFTAGVVAAGDRAALVLETWAHMSGVGSLAGRRLLDLGAGTAPLAIAATRAGARVVAIDAGLRWLVIASQRCREAGVDVQLVCANAEALPLPDGAMDLVAGESVLENVRDQPATLREACRVLAPAGALWLSTPNKLFPGPDPHVGLLAGGWFSDGFVARYAARRGMVPPQRHLLSERTLRRSVSAAGFDHVRCAVPDVAEAQRRNAPPHVRLAVDVYRLARRLPVVRGLLQVVAPTLLLTAVRGVPAPR